MYSQFDEEKIILEVLGSQPPGRLLDVGAYDGLELSNSRALIERGWSAVLVEPAPHNVTRLLHNNEPFASKVKIVQAAVAGSTGLNRLYMDDTSARRWATTINLDLLEAGHVEKQNPIHFYVPTIMIHDLAPFGPFQFITIDAEWEDYQIMLQFPPYMLESVQLLCVETRHDAQRVLMKSLLKSYGLEVIHETPPNVLAKRI